MHTSENHLRIAAELSQVPVACQFVAKQAARAGLDEHAIYHCELAVDEACTNIVEHAYDERHGDEVIDIICRVQPAHFVIVILDDGPPFNPLTRPDPDPSASLEERTGGGWGIHFIKRLIDEVYYNRANNRNTLTLVKRL